MIEYDLLKRRVGVRRYDMLENPLFTKASSTQLPFGGILHYYTDSPDVLGPNLDNPFLRDINRPIFIDHIIDLKTHKGNPRLLSLPVQPLIKQHRRNNRAMRPLVNRESVARDKKSILVENYCLMERRYRYQPGIWTGYNRWYNTWSTLCNTVALIAQEMPERQQFIQIEMPQRLPSRADLKLMENRGMGTTPAMLRKHGDPQSLTLVDLFTWIGPFRGTTALDAIPEANYGTINLCFIDSGYWTFINLGDLNRWRKSTQGEIKQVDTSDEMSDEEKAERKKALLKGGSVDPKILQISFFSFLIKLYKLRSESAGDRVADAVLEAGKKEDAEKELNEPKEEEKVEINTSVKDAVADGGDTDSTGEQTAVEGDTQIRMMDEAEIESMMDENVKLVEEFDFMSEAVDNAFNDKTLEVEALLGKPLPAEEAVVKIADDYAKRGAITADAYRRAVKGATKFKTLPNPVPGKTGTLEDLIELDPARITLPDKSPITKKPIKGVTDASMNYATKDAMDKRYLDEFHHKNIARMALAPQKVGISVHDYKIKRTDTHFGSYEIHTLKLAPVGGAPSQVQFKVPVIEKDGSYRSGGSRYRMRPQRTD